MKIKIMFIIPAIALVILGLSLIFTPTEIQMTLVGVILVTLGILLFVAYAIYRGPK